MLRKDLTFSLILMLLGKFLNKVGIILFSHTFEAFIINHSVMPSKAQFLLLHGQSVYTTTVCYIGPAIKVDLQKWLCKLQLQD